MTEFGLIDLNEFKVMSKKLTDKQFKGDETITNSLITNIRQRIIGRVDLMMERNNGLIKSNFSILDTNLVVIDNILPIHRIYIGMTGNKSVPTIVGNYDSKTLMYVRDSEEFNGLILNPGLKLADIKKLQKVIFKKTPNMAFLNKLSKEYAIKIRSDLISLPINPYATNLVIYDYDNRVHHNENLLDIVNSKIQKI